MDHAAPAVLSDQTKSISADYGVLVKDKGIPLRGLFIIDPEGNLQQARCQHLRSDARRKRGLPTLIAVFLLAWRR